MTGPLWNKGGATPNERMQAFLCGEDLRWDRILLPFDIQATRAHVRGLERIGLLETDEAEELSDGLRALTAALSAGTYKLEPPHEDGHSAIETFLCECCGELGKKVHTGRSRNDQVQVALRLYMRDRLKKLATSCAAIAAVSLHQARHHQETVVPGYTHLQRAVPSTLGLWFAAWCESFLDIRDLATQTAAWLNTSPLGSAAGYGVNLPLDREGIADELGFPRIQINPLYCQSARGRFELQVLSAFAQAALELRRLAWDLSLFASAEFGFVRLPDDLTTGSSIMPNKRNPDLVEVLRSVAATIAGAQIEIHDSLSIPSGYHRDLQATKAPLLRGCEYALEALSLVPVLVEGLSFDEERMREAIDQPMHSTDLAIEAARAGIPFRDAYRQANQLPDERTAEQSTKARVSPGACADLRLEELQARLDN